MQTDPNNLPNPSFEAASFMNAENGENPAVGAPTAQGPCKISIKHFNNFILF